MSLPISELSSLEAVAEPSIQVMPEGTWWGLKFIDSKYLGNWSFSPHIEVFRHRDNEYRVKISGSHEIDPSLTKEQLDCLGFLGWEQTEGPNCDCLFSPYVEPRDALAWFRSGIESLEVIFGIASGCAIAGSNDFVNEKLSQLPGSRWSRKFGGYRLTGALYNRIDLR